MTDMCIDTPLKYLSYEKVAITSTICRLRSYKWLSLPPIVLIFCIANPLSFLLLFKALMYQCS